MTLFCAKTLPEPELAGIAEHLAKCQPCHQEFTQELRRQRPSADIGFTLAPEFWFQHDHLDFEQLVSLADNKLDKELREIIDIHLSVCGTCREDVRSFLEFRKKTAPEMEVSYGAVRREPVRPARVSWWPLPWEPVYAVATILFIVLATVIVVTVLRRRTESLEAQKNKPTQINVATSPAPSTNINSASAPSPSATQPPKPPSRIPSPTAAESPTLVAILRDGPRQVSLDRQGHVSGLEEAPSTTQREVADAMLAQRIEGSDVLKDLVGPSSSLRGTNRSKSFRLLSPGRTVIIDNQPTFKWERVPDATSYRVYVGDLRGHEVATSDELPSDRIEWTASKQLRRGEVYSWSVVAVVNGKEVVSPFAAAPEMRFQILSERDLKDITQVKKTRSHLALGVVYAKSGLLTEAEREFQQLVESNPQSELARKLLRSVRSLRESKNH
jgi:hypothetical protein